MVFCKIKNCTTKKGERTVFNIPYDPKVRSEWAKQIRRHQSFDDTTITYPVCILHFTPVDIKIAGKRTTIKKGSVPTIFPCANGDTVVLDLKDDEELPDIDSTVGEYENNSHSTMSLSIEPISNTKQKNVSAQESPNQKENDVPNVRSNINTSNMECSSNHIDQ
ncbi:THAP domain-containing protein 1-like [Contarinia nasturtii]|uniref:THAP domain-containing protein 1-like n=1 Tax=Contarinia nasturtii TaxID=265458 RepID=UPI0012D45B25|nr:THAP domain-containing protein 1-like [Contarinia nasturtii]